MSSHRTRSPHPSAHAAAKASIPLCLLALMACTDGGSGPGDPADMALTPPAEADAEPPDADPSPCIPGAEGCPCAAGRCGLDDAGDPLACRDDVCMADPCPAGARGCPCDGDTCRGDDSVCEGDVCIARACEPGETGCMCDAADGCALPDDACVDGICRPDGCTPGESGCACNQGRCLDADHACVDGHCAPDPCPRGTLGCGCTAGSCGPGLACEQDTCVEQTGRLGGPCAEDDGCLDGLGCLDGICLPCQPGTLGCPCAADGACLPGAVCEADRCVDIGDVMPADGLCYTPCSNGIVDADTGAFVRCPSDKLMPGCPLSGFECRAGSCLRPGDAVPVCAHDYDCPDHQICAGGRCVSDCVDDGDCGPGQRCYQKACRDLCDNDEAPCGPDHMCTGLADEQTICLPYAPSFGEPRREVPGIISVSRQALALGGTTTSGVFGLRNQSDTRQILIVRKRTHRLFTAQGAVEDRRDVFDPEAVEPCDPQRECPLTWLRIGEQFEAEIQQDFQVVLPPGEETTIEVSGADLSPGVRWQGELEVLSETLNPVRIALEYSETPDGQWKGTAYTFSQFAVGGLDDWLAGGHGGVAPPFAAGTRDDPATQRRVANALVQAWGTFRRGRMSPAEFEAVLAATRTGTWTLPAVRDACRDTYGADAVCFLAEGAPGGVGLYTSDQSSNPVPAGLVDLPVVFNLRVDPEGPALSGRIDARATLHYAGDAAVRLPLDTDPTDCSRDTGGACLVFFDADATRPPCSGGACPDSPPGHPIATIAMGGRYAPGPDACAAGFTAVAVPWLPTDFVRDVDDGVFPPVRWECRRDDVPFVGDAPANVDLAGANPIPDGQPLVRELWLLDGALINQSQLFIFFEERFTAFAGDDEARVVSKRGFMILRRDRQGDLDTADDDGDGVPDVFRGNPPVEVPPGPVGLLGDISCPADIEARLPGEPGDPGARDARVRTLIDGVDLLGGFGDCIAAARDGGLQACLDPEESVHYLCDGHFDGGPDRLRCPEGARVEFFTLLAAEGRDPSADPCNDDATCADVLVEWRDGGVLFQDAPRWICADPEARLCNDGDADDGIRRDMRAGRIFFGVDGAVEVFPSLRQATLEAFRYKIQFRNREGRNIGFAPEVCGDGQRNPYCYDPAGIEELRGRVDCMVAELEAERADPALDGATLRRLTDTLREAFSAGPVDAGLTRAQMYDGFERLYAELLVMQGDDALTRAFGSRFDLAGGRGGAFPGSDFERGGDDLSGVAGVEMRLLYTAHQYYQEALQRFYGQAPSVLRSARGAEAYDFVTPGMVLDYVERLVGAATQKAKAASEIARRYQSFDRTDLARAVLEREFTAAYLESVVLNHMMLDIVAGVEPEQRAQLRRFDADAQKRYRAALLDMSRVYSTLRDNVNAFGFASDYVPSFTIDVRETNAFERALRLAQERMRLAREREDAALLANRAFETDTVEFQSELVRIRNTYESQLRELCGSIPIEDGGLVVDVVPATRAYAHLVPHLAGVGDPCGFVGNGDIHAAFGQMELSRLELVRIKQQMDNVNAEIEIELGRIGQQCGICAGTCDDETLFEIARGRTQRRGAQRVDLEQDLRTNRYFSARLQGAAAVAGAVAQAVACNTVRCGVATGVYAGLAGVAEVGTAALEFDALEKEVELLEMQEEDALWELERACELAELDSQARVDTTLLRLKELELEALRADYQMRLTLAEIGRLFNRGQKLQLEQDEAEQLAIDVAVARNDPNKRIYRNDAVINADVAFDAAMRDAYRATLVYEYYTSQSYARRGDLFLTRLVARGERNLEDYLAELQNAFFEFEEAFGLPNLRVMKVSLMNDIFRIRRLDDDGSPLTASARQARLRARLRDPALLDRRGYLNIPFQTRLSSLSPATRNHKVFKVVAEISGEATDEGSARLYLVQGGTSIIHAVDGETLFYRLPEQTAVLNARFTTGAAGIDPAIYDNLRLRDRPMAATDWQLIINQRDEAINQDLDLGSVSDIVLFIYYTDFTEF